jgi:hypothetical protein
MPRMVPRLAVAAAAVSLMALVLHGCGGAAVQEPTSPDLRAAGAIGRDMLRASPYTDLVIEADYAPGMQPSAAALNHLAQVIGEYAAKPGGIRFAGGNAFASSQTAYSMADIRSIEARNRSQHTSGHTVAIYVLYLNGVYSPATNTVGLSYEATGFAVFKERLTQAAVAPATPLDLERADLVHEFGHLLGLVNINYTSAYDHEDTNPNHAGGRYHCRFANCAMYYAIESVGPGGGLLTAPQDDYDADCRADIAQIKGQ